MTVVWLKFIHVASLSIWAGGILLLPVLLGQRQAAGEGPPLHRLHLFTRFAYVVVVSPAAFLAIASGTALILAREIHFEWFALKLLLVGMLVSLHVWVGLLVLTIFDQGGHFARWRVLASLVTLSALMLAIFWLVLAKPAIPLGFLPENLFRPGGLSELWGAVQPSSDTMMPTP
ncbi:CopD family protein [Aureimonas psammosilenae]|uniref:CopD family protein n=1 Tax=Aureimonas psammosilenae TaxID=2495496 RepID=UPI0012612DA4|nr:CopD family protein [Aureimonas psammosilenae]